MEAFDVLGDPVRRRILELLAGGEAPAGEVVDVLVTFGELTDTSIAAAKESASSLRRTMTVVRFGSDQREEITNFLREELNEGDMVLLKGARGLEMETIVQALRREISGGMEP